jgi:hypothetical protein
VIGTREMTTGTRVETSPDGTVNNTKFNIITS